MLHKTGFPQLRGHLFIHPDPTVRKGRFFCCLEEIEIGHDEPVGQGMPDSFFQQDGVPVCFGQRSFKEQGLPKALPDVAGRPFAESGLALAANIQIGKETLPDGGTGFFDGKQGGATLQEGPAGSLERAGRAIRMLRRTLNRPEIHHSLIEVCCLSGRQEFLGPCGEDPFPLGCSDGFGNPEIPGEHGGWQTEGDGADGRCGIISHALQGADTVQRIREAPGGGNLFGGGVQVPGPAVIAQALPKPQD